MKNVRKLIVLTVLLVAPWGCIAHAQIYKTVDSQGNISYSNTPVPGGKRVELEPPTVIPGPKAKPAAPRTAASATAKASRDATRRQLLETELQSETKQLEEAKQRLVEGEAVRLGNERNFQKYLDRVQGLKDEVAVHEKNVAAIQKQLNP